jgi:FAD/FMN-containing dehydrogenase
MSVVLNDVHSQLNATAVAQVVRPQSLEELQAIVKHARSSGVRLSIAGGRHAMGGQQFAEAALNIDMTALDRVLASDAGRGLLRIEAGAEWPAIIAATHRMDAGAAHWGIRQKQTGVDAAGCKASSVE